MHTQGYNYADIMLEHMPVGVALFDAQDLRLLAANALYQSFLLPEWRDGRAIGHPLSDWGPQPYTCFIEPLLCKVAETGIPYRAEEVHIPRPKRGHTYWNWTIDPVRDSNGHIMHLLNTASDVTGQVLARQATEQAHASLSQVNQVVEAESTHIAAALAHPRLHAAIESQEPVPLNGTGLQEGLTSDRPLQALPD